MIHGKLEPLGGGSVSGVAVRGGMRSYRSGEQLQPSRLDAALVLMKLLDRWVNNGSAEVRVQPGRNQAH